VFEPMKYRFWKYE